MSEFLSKVLAGVVGAVVIAIVFWFFGFFREEFIVPPGAVLAFEEGCPGGWRPYTAAQGKFVLGAGNETDSTSSGGSPKLKFNALRIRTAADKYVKNTEDVFIPVGKRIDVDEDGVAEFMEVEAMPPYLSLRFCIK